MADEEGLTAPTPPPVAAVVDDRKAEEAVTSAEPPKKRRGRSTKAQAAAKTGESACIDGDGDKAADAKKTAKKTKKEKVKKTKNGVEKNNVETLAAAAKAIADASSVGMGKSPPTQAEPTPTTTVDVATGELSSVPTTTTAAGSKERLGPAIPGDISTPIAAATVPLERPPAVAPTDSKVSEAVPVGAPIKTQPISGSKRGSVTHSEEPGNGKRPRVVLQVQMEEGGWNKDLLEMTTVELNKFLKKSQYTEIDTNKLKKTRRRVKNRIYAQRSRARKVVINPDGTKPTLKKAAKKEAKDKNVAESGVGEKAAAESIPTTVTDNAVPPAVPAAIPIGTPGVEALLKKIESGIPPIVVEKKEDSEAPKPVPVPTESIIAV